MKQLSPFRVIVGLVIVGLLGTVPLLVSRTHAAPAAVRTERGAGISIELWSRPRQLAASCLLVAVHSGVAPSADLADQCVEAASAVFAATARR